MSISGGCCSAGKRKNGAGETPRTPGPHPGIVLVSGSGPQDRDESLQPIAAITSCTNTSNPGVLVAAGLVAKKADELGLKPKPWVKTSLAPGSQVVTDYLDKAGLTAELDAMGRKAARARVLAHEPIERELPCQ